MFFRQQGKEVLGVDLDPQNGLCLHFGLSPRHIGGLSRATLAADAWSNSITQCPTGDYVLPYGLVSEDDRISFEQALQSNPYLLSEQLSRLEITQDSIVIIDTPPGASVYLTQALMAANAVLVVVLADAASYATLPKMIGLIHKYCSVRNDFLGQMFLINQADRIRQLAGDVMDLIQMKLADYPIAIIHQDQSIPEALARGEGLMDYDPLCRGVFDMKACIDKINQLIEDAHSVQAL